MYCEHDFVSQDSLRHIKSIQMGQCTDFIFVRSYTLFTYTYFHKYNVFKTTKYRCDSSKYSMTPAAKSSVGNKN